MSPYCACMNTLCAWPAPSRAHDAVVVLRHAMPGGQSFSASTSRVSTPAVEKSHRSSATPSQLQSPSSGSSGSMLTDILQPEKKENVQAQIVASPPGSDAEDEDEGDVVPVESLAKNGSKDVPPPEEKPKRRSWFGAFGSQHKEERVLKKYWRFVGFRVSLCQFSRRYRQILLMYAASSLSSKIPVSAHLWKHTTQAWIRCSASLLAVAAAVRPHWVRAWEQSKCTRAPSRNLAAARNLHPIAHRSLSLAARHPCPPLTASRALDLRLLRLIGLSARQTCRITMSALSPRALATCRCSTDSERV